MIASLQCACLQAIIMIRNISNFNLRNYFPDWWHFETRVKCGRRYISSVMLN